MKKLFILTAVLALSLSFATTAGPLMGIQVAPAINSTAALTFGWDFGDLALEGAKTNFNTWYSDWSIAALWTPARQTFSYRVGPKLVWNWNTAGKLTFTGLEVVVGASKTWGAFQVYGELDIGSTGALRVKPLIGLNILFERFFLETSE